MFSLNQGDELVFQIQNNNPNPEQHTIQQDLVMDQASPKGGNKRHRKKQSLSMGEDDIKDDERSKKIMHREIERQRRQEMGQLHGSLRSLLPLEFIKGKRSISDHMQQAVNYINHLQRSIRELNIKRDKLDKIPNYTTVISQGSGSSNFCLLSNDDNINVTVAPCFCGVEIIITSGSMKEQFPLSRVMKVLIQEGELNISSCASTRVNDRLLLTIRAEAIDPLPINMSELQQKLCDVIRG